jgi:ABC-type branched-subunit amino acid transport system ATPase component
MFDAVRLRNFRAFQDFTLSGLSRVNLLVGKNNAGKTSLLEAIEIISMGGRPGSLLQSPSRRGEVSTESDERFRSRLDVRNLFSGHKLSESSWFELTARSGTHQSVIRCDVRRAQLTESEEDLLFSGTERSAQFALHVKGPGNPDGSNVILSPLGTVVGRYVLLPKQPGESNVVFLGTKGEDVNSLQKSWGDIVLTAEEEKVIAAMKIIEPSVERLAFTGDAPRYSSVAFVKLSNDEQRIPLGSLGDGMRRLLALAINIAQASGGVLLVDEIDTGLHYTSLEMMWRFVIETARRLNVQVFATSHSGDCIRALAWLQTDMPELAADVSVHRVERNASAAVRYSASEIEVSARHHIEVRG